MWQDSHLQVSFTPHYSKKCGFLLSFLGIIKEKYQMANGFFRKQAESEHFTKKQARPAFNVK
ncbi:hypothetical protein Sez_1817 [Streptococcus equi subsp. zooepidemicus MGCS10565]|uniref:Uncharacterized protein n=1 Tax=Streptococcus equi subsp. zooepidemicus (strain MGCS10565) TaxID=552526 RepID=B4U5D3_STREM|nr:hypothetical protein Sez_1817 [Streptococcus equi subsp. zooepidemicus MGCS10565]